MGRKYTWAFIDTNAAATATSPEGGEGAIQVQDTDGTFTGSEKLRFMTTSVSPSQLYVSGNINVTGDISASGDVYAVNYKVKNVEVIHAAGSTSFGDSSDDTHDFTGKLQLSEITTPTPAPDAGAGGYLYTKADGQPYWRSFEQSEVNLNLEIVDLNNTFTGENTFEDKVTIEQNDNQPGLDVNQTGNEFAIDASNTSPSHGVAKFTAGALGAATAVKIDGNLITGGRALEVQANNLTNGIGIDVTSTSNSTSARTLINVANDHVDAINCIPLKIRQDAIGDIAKFQYGSGRLFTVMTDGVVVGAKSTADALLEVAGDGIAEVRINDIGSGDPRLSFALGGTTKFTIGVDDSDGDNFKIGTTALDVSSGFAINGSGQVGIGSVNSAAFPLNIPLTVSGSDSKLIRLESAGDNNGVDIGCINNGTFEIRPATGQVTIKAAGSDDSYLAFDVNGTNAWCIGTDDSDNKFKIGTTALDTNTAITIDRTTRNVGIGISDPSEKLHVNGGNIRIGEASTWGASPTTTTTTTAKLEMISNANAGDVQAWITAYDGSPGQQRLTLGTRNDHDIYVYRQNSVAAKWLSSGLQLETALSGPTDSSFNYYSDASHNFYIDADNDNTSLVRFYNGAAELVHYFDEDGDYTQKSPVGSIVRHYLSSSNSNSSWASELIFRKYNSSNAIAAGENLGELSFEGSEDGNVFKSGAKITVETPGGTTWDPVTSTPGSFLFQTVPDGSTTLTNAMIIDHDQSVKIANSLKPIDTSLPISIDGHRNYMWWKASIAAGDDGDEKIVYPSPSEGDALKSTQTSPLQYKYCWIAPADGYIELIEAISIYNFGIGITSPFSTIKWYKQAGSTKTDLSGLTALDSDGATMGYATGLGTSTAGSPRTFVFGKSSCSFSAGDKLWMTFTPGHNSFYNSGGTITTSTNYVNFQIVYVLEESNFTS